ncbi:parallel beta-helix repeat protein [Bradyrhizobium sp. CIR3A]|nr:parallel beta-helix repeat protein [Bradyrhizobium sp. CIR3A]
MGDENNPPILVYRDADAALEEDIALLSISSASVISNVSIIGLHFLCARKRRKLTPRPLIYAQNVRSFTFEGNIVENSSYGIFLRNVSDFKLTRNRIRRSIADGIQASNQGSQASGARLTRGEISYNHLQLNGDDCIAVGSQAEKGKQAPSEITVHHNLCERQGPQGGGIGIYGSEDIQIYNNVIVGVSKHGIAIVADTNNRQESNRRILVENNVIIDIERSDYSRDKYYNCAIVIGNRNSRGDASYLAGPFAYDVQIRGNAVYTRNRNGIVVSVGERFRENKYLSPARVAVAGNTLINMSGQVAGIAGFTIVGAEDVTLSDNSVVGYDK